jgi:hypothetical protein
MVVKMTANHERLISCMNINDLLTPPKNICLLIHIEWITLTAKIFVSTHIAYSSCHSKKRYQALCF